MGKFPGPVALEKHPRIHAIYISSLPRRLQKMSEGVIKTGRPMSASPGVAHRFRPELPPLPSSPPHSLVTTDQTELALVQLAGQSHKDQVPRETLRAPHSPVSGTASHPPARPISPRWGKFRLCEDALQPLPTRMLLPSFQLSVIRAVRPFIIVKEH